MTPVRLESATPRSQVKHSTTESLHSLMAKYDLSDTRLVDLTSNFFVLCTKMEVYLYSYSLWVELSMNSHEGKG